VEKRVAIIFFIAIFVFKNAELVIGAEPSRNPRNSPEAALIFKPRIEYPYEARRQRITGTGIIIIQVDRATGNVTDVRMLQSTGSSILDGASVSAFRRARFKPGTEGPVKIPIAFTMGRSAIFGPPVFEYQVKQKPMDRVLAHFLGEGVVRRGPIPEYPLSPPWSEKHGEGLYELHVRKDGTVAEVKTLKSSGDAIFDREATETLRKWQLTRGPLIIVLPLKFRLSSKSYSVVIPEKL
jgi:TonB family protein